MCGMDAMIGNIYTYTLPCKEILRERKGIVFTYGPSAKWAEASPLPGRSHDTFEEVLEVLGQLRRDIPKTLPPSLAFALDTHDLLGFSSPLPICRLLAGSSEKIIEDAKRLHLEGATYVKVKVTGLPIGEAVALVQELQRMFRVRIDANRSWSLEEAYNFTEHFSIDDIEFFEEPLQNPSELAFFPLPFALDESLLEPSIEPLLSLPNLHTLVLKPTLLGGKAGCLYWIQRCMELKLQWVISSAFESGIGILQLARLLASLPPCSAPAGLDSYSFLAEDLLETPLEFYGGTLKVPENFHVQNDRLCSI